MGLAASTASEGALVGEPWPAWGFRVISVEAGSPAARALVFPDRQSAAAGVRAPFEAPLVPYLDVVVSVNGVALGEESSRTGVFEREVAGSVDKPMLLEVYNVKTRRQRLVQMTPSRAWGGDGLLGLQVHHDALGDDADAVLHVMEVEAGSPAAQYGFVANDDYLLGTMDGPFKSVDEFVDFCTNATVGETVLLFLLSTASDAVRAVVIVWDETLTAHGLGVTLASGHIHTMPNRTTLGRPAWPGDGSAADAASTSATSTTAAPLPSGASGDGISAVGSVAAASSAAAGGGVAVAAGAAVPPPGPSPAAVQVGGGGTSAFHPVAAPLHPHPTGVLGATAVPVAAPAAGGLAPAPQLAAAGGSGGGGAAPTAGLLR